MESLLDGLFVIMLSRLMKNFGMNLIKFLKVGSKNQKQMVLENLMLNT